MRCNGKKIWKKLNDCVDVMSKIYWFTLLTSHLLYFDDSTAPNG